MRQSNYTVVSCANSLELSVVSCANFLELSVGSCAHVPFLHVCTVSVQSLYSISEVFCTSISILKTSLSYTVEKTRSSSPKAYAKD